LASSSTNKADKVDKADKPKAKKYYKSSGSNTNTDAGKHKVFDKDLSDAFDIKARETIKTCLGSGIIDNPNKYGEDMIVLTSRIPYGYIELQVYGKWIDVFPYPMPYIYERKMRFNPNTLFICFNVRFDKAIVFSKSAIDPQKYRVEKYSREYIHYVKWHKAMVLDVSSLTYDSIECYASPIEYFEKLHQKDELIELIEQNEKNGLIEQKTHTPISIADLEDLADIID
jgi:hypothetical protein